MENYESLIMDAIPGKTPIMKHRKLVEIMGIIKSLAYDEFEECSGLNTRSFVVLEDNSTPIGDFAISILDDLKNGKI